MSVFWLLTKYYVLFIKKLPIKNINMKRDKENKKLCSKPTQKPHKGESPKNPLLIEPDQSEIYKTQDQDQNYSKFPKSVLFQVSSNKVNIGQTFSNLVKSQIFGPVILQSFSKTFTHMNKNKLVNLNFLSLVTYFLLFSLLSFSSCIWHTNLCDEWVGEWVSEWGQYSLYL